MRLAALSAIAVLTASTASAQETVDIGTIAEQDIVVVQRLLYPKDGRTEFGAHVGMMVDALLFTPNLQLSFDKHFSERVSFSALVGGGYGIKNGTYRRLNEERFGVEPNAYRYLGSVLAGVAWAPVYAKMNVGADRILHHDVYGVARAGVSFEASTIPQGGFFPSPTVSLGLGARIWTSESFALRVELRDDIMLQARKLEENQLYLKQNLGVTVGISRFSAPKQRRR